MFVKSGRFGISVNQFSVTMTMWWVTWITDQQQSFIWKGGGRGYLKGTSRLKNLVFTFFFSLMWWWWGGESVRQWAMPDRASKSSRSRSESTIHLVWRSVIIYTNTNSECLHHHQVIVYPFTTSLLLYLEFPRYGLCY